MVNLFELKRQIKVQLDAELNELFLFAQDALGATTGDISPMQMLKLLDLQESLAALIVEFAVQNKPEVKDEN